MSKPTPEEKLKIFATIEEEMFRASKDFLIANNSSTKKDCFHHLQEIDRILSYSLDENTFIDFIEKFVDTEESLYEYCKSFLYITYYSKYSNENLSELRNLVSKIDPTFHVLRIFSVFINVLICEILKKILDRVISILKIECEINVDNFNFYLQHVLETVKMDLLIYLDTDLVSVYYSDKKKGFLSFKKNWKECPEDEEQRIWFSV